MLFLCAGAILAWDLDVSEIFRRVAASGGGWRQRIDSIAFRDGQIHWESIDLHRLVCIYVSGSLGLFWDSSEILLGFWNILLIFKPFKLSEKLQRSMLISWRTDEPFRAVGAYNNWQKSKNP